MLRNWKLLGLSTLLTATLAAPAGEGNTDGKLPTQDPIKKVEQQVEELDKKLTKQLAGLTEQLSQDFKKIGEGFKKIAEVDAAHAKRLDSLEANDTDTRLKLSDVQIKLGRLEKQLKAMSDHLEALRKQSRVDLSPPLDDKTLEEIRNRLAAIEQKLNGLPQVVAKAPPVASTGRVVLVNLYPSRVLFLVGGRAYPVDPGMSTTVQNLPAGALPYEVIVDGYGTVRRNQPILGPGETLTITAR
ncbi:MAG: hypothetical protein L0Z62_34325 [Gemmataceae bacterium]|nr:hypothetical protein [Gemmataceae bacterium]